MVSARNPKKRIRLVVMMPKLTSSNCAPRITLRYKTWIVSSTIKPRQTIDVTEVNRFRSNSNRQKINTKEDKGMRLARIAAEVKSRDRVMVKISPKMKIKETNSDLNKESAVFELVSLMRSPLL